jgi:hypothetical protein
MSQHFLQRNNGFQATPQKKAYKSVPFLFFFFLGSSEIKGNKNQVKKKKKKIQQKKSRV